MESLKSLPEVFVVIIKHLLYSVEELTSQWVVRKETTESAESPDRKDVAIGVVMNGTGLVEDTHDVFLC